jgi:flagellar export protein FliJ
MSPAKYRLQPVFDKKEKLKKDAEKALADTRAGLVKQEEILQQKEEAVKQAIKKKEDYSADLTAKMDKGMEMSKITAAKAYLEVLKQNIETAKKKVEEQKAVVREWEKKVEVALEKVTEATKEMKVIEKHKENWVAAVKKEEEEKEDKENEEVAQNLYEMNRRQRSS